MPYLGDRGIVDKKRPAPFADRFLLVFTIHFAKRLTKRPAPSKMNPTKSTGIRKLVGLPPVVGAVAGADVVAVAAGVAADVAAVVAAVVEVAAAVAAVVAAVVAVAVGVSVPCAAAGAKVNRGTASKVPTTTKRASNLMRNTTPPS